MSSQAHNSILLALALSFLAGNAAAETRPMKDTLELCESYRASTSDYVDGFKALGWREVTGEEGERIIDRVIWIDLPRIQSNNIDVTAHFGAYCGHQHCGRPTLGKLYWSNTAEIRAFATGESVLFVFFRPQHHYPNTPKNQLQDYHTCSVIVAPGPLANEMQSLLEVERLTEGHSGWLGSITKERWPFNHNLDLPRSTIRTEAFIPDQSVIAEHSLDFLNYKVGFRTEYSYTYTTSEPPQ